MIHFTFEGSFLWLSTFGRQVNTSEGPFAELCESWKVPTTDSPLTTSTREGVRPR